MPDMATRRPNIVVIVADDTHPAFHGCYGGRTPTHAIDRLAREGAILERSYCASPLCNPSRFSLFTGRYCGHAASVRGAVPPGDPYCIMQNAELRPGMPTLATMLRAGGYRTGHMGKWHSDFAHGREGDSQDRVKGGSNLDDPAVDAQMRRNHEIQRGIVMRSGGFEFADRVNWGNLDAGDKALPFHNVPWQTEGALEFLDGVRSDSRPFYLHIANSVPHGPCPLKSLHRDGRYTQGGRRDRAPTCHPDDASILTRMQENGLGVTGAIAGINVGMMMMDDQIAAILRKLEELGLDRDTIVISTADHGVKGKGSCHHAGFHMGTLIRWPNGIPAGTRVAEPISHVDLVPTLLHAAGVAPSAPMDGISALPRLMRGEAHVRDDAFVEMGWARSVICGRWHYIAWRPTAKVLAELEAGKHAKAVDQHGYFGGMFGDLSARWRPNYFDADQLYDTVTDPYERTNLAGQPGYARILDGMRARLDRYLAGIDAPFERRAPAFMQSSAWKTLVEARMAAIAQVPYHPQGHDPDPCYQMNVDDPLPE
jgi:choline-sulfatase